MKKKPLAEFKAWALVDKTTGNLPVCWGGPAHNLYETRAQARGDQGLDDTIKRVLVTVREVE